MMTSTKVRIFFLHYTAASFFLPEAQDLTDILFFYCFTETVCLLLLFTGFVELHLCFNISLVKAEAVFCERGTRCVLNAW